MSVANDLISTARVNATYIGSEYFGSCTNDGVYDGLIGNLESNDSDFSIVLVGIQSLFDEKCAFPVKFDSIFGQINNHLISTPDTNVTKSEISVYEAFLIFDWNIGVTMLSIFFLSAFLLSKSASVNKSKRCIWTLIKIWLHQDTNDDISKIQSTRAILTLSKLLILLFLIFIAACMNTDLVSYTKPIIINSVSDAIESGIKVAFSFKSTTFPIAKAAPEGSPCQILFSHALNQSRYDNKSILYSDESRTAIAIKERSLITVLSEQYFGITKRIDCLNYDPNNYIHSSRQVLFSELETILFSFACNSELRKRINVIFNSVLEFGILDKEKHDSSDRIFNQIFGVQVPIACIHNDLDSENQLLNSVSYNNICPLLILFLKLFLICLFIFISENILFKTASDREKSKILFRVRKRRIIKT